MEEPMARTDDLAEKPFDPEMTEPDEANAPDDTGPTAEGGNLGGGGTPGREAGDQEEVGI